MLDVNKVNELKINKQYDQLIVYLNEYGNIEDAYCQYNLGEAYYHKKDYALSLYYYTQAINQNYADAFAALAYQYANGSGIEKDTKKAFDLYLKGEELNQETAKINVGICYYNGSGVEKNYVKAVERFKQLTRYSVANYLLGKIYYQGGYGVEQNENLAVHYFKQAANNFLDAHGFLASIYYYGKGVAKDNGKAYEWALKGMYENDGDSIYILGLMFEDKSAIDYMLFSPSRNDNLDKDAFNMFKKGEALGHEQCKFKVAEFYFFGIGTAQNYTEAIHRFMQLTHLPSVNYYLGEAYRLGVGVPKNKSLAYQYYEIAAKNNVPQAYGKLAFAYYNEKDYQKAYDWAIKGAYLSDGQCCFILGQIYTHGVLGTKDEKTAFEYYLLGQSYEDCQYEVANAYYFGNGVKQDRQEAFNRYKKIDHLSNAQMMLGQCYYFGEGCTKDYKLAFHYFEKAAKSGDSNAQGNLAHMYYAGEGVEINNERVYHWATKAAMGEVAMGYHYLAALYAEGLYVSQNHYKAFENFYKAANLGDAKSQYWLAMAYKEGKGTYKDLSLYYDWIKTSANNGDEKAIEEFNNYQKRGFIY